MVQVSRKLSLLHRSRIDIIANILRAAERGAKKTHIMYKCNLSFRQLHYYLDFLVERGLLKTIRAKSGERNDSNTYETTSKGKAFIQAYNSIRAILSS
jgi:predicted transcriptional regulator